MKNPFKDMTLLPPKMERWLVDRLLPVFLHRASQVYGNNPSTQNARWVTSGDIEMKLAYDCLGKNAWMYAAGNAIATSAAMLPCGVYKRKVSTKGGDYELDEDDKITQLFEKPNLWQTAEEFKEQIMWSLELSGLLFIEVVGTIKAPQEMYVLDPRKMKVVKDAKNFISGYDYDLNGHNHHFNPEDIIFHRYVHPADPYAGLAPSTPAGDSINSDISSNEYNNAFFGNSGIPALALETEKRMTEEEADKLAASWGRTYKGAKKAHKVAVLWGGLKATVLQRSPKDMEFTKQKILNREEMLAAYGVPPVLVGLLESANYSNTKEQKKIFWQHTMKPKLVGLAKRFNLSFGLDGFKRKFMFDLTEVDALQEEEETKSRVAFNLSKCGFSWDEIRKRVYNMPPCEGGVGKYPWVPTNMVPSNLQMNGPVAAPAPAGKPGKPDGPESGKPGEGKKPDAATTNNKPAKSLDDLSPKEAELQALLDKIESMMQNETGNGEKILIG